MMNVVSWELARRRMFTVWWSIGVSALIVMTVLSYLAIEDQTEKLNQALGDMSSSIGSFIGGSDLFSPVGYLSSQVYYIMLPLLLIIMVLTLVSSLVSKDENDMTVELTLSRPISRSRLLLSKALAGIIIMTIVGVGSYVVTVLCVLSVGLDIDLSNLLLTHILAFAFSVSFGAIAFAMIAFSKVTRHAAGIIAILLSFGGYIISSLAGFVDVLQPVAKVLPYNYYDTIELLGGIIDRGLLIYLCATFALCTFMAWYGYSRRDIG